MQTNKSRYVYEIFPSPISISILTPHHYFFPCKSASGCLFCNTNMRRITRGAPMKLPKILFVLLFAALSQIPTFASTTDSLKTYHLADSIVVIANRYRVSLKTVTNSVDLIPVKDFPQVADYSVLQLVDMLSPAAFVFDKKVMGYGVGVAGAGNLTLRGLGGKPNSQVLVLINGRPDFMGIFGHPLPDVYGLDGIEKIEVVKGPSSAVFGSNAIAGVVNLITSSPTRNQVLFSARAGNYNTYLQRTSLNLQTGQ
ncbi:MAG TPA: hypothetical protein ENK14_11325, partial [Caldithrix sp.]|nr:hypothetical protein [Caldithrix sp.]